MSCATGACQQPGACRVCAWLAVPQQPERCQVMVDGKRCRFIKWHLNDCEMARAVRAERPAAPDLVELSDDE